VRAFADLIPEITVHREVMQRAASQGFTTATDLADYLVRKGIAFRDAHAVVGRTVRYALEKGVELDALTVAELHGFSPVIGEDVLAVLKIEGSIAARAHFGGTAPRQVRAAVRRAHERLAAGSAAPAP
jgi:argininosuccinate lyase